MSASATAMATDDFSFPTTANLYPSGIESPPLWRLSPAASPDVFLDRRTSAKESLHSRTEEEEEVCFPDSPEKHEERKRFPCEEKGSKQYAEKVVVGEDDDEEEKMDLLWEDFNEELQRRRISRSSSRCSGDHRVEELGCVEAFKLSKNNTAAAAMWRPGMLVFMKVLKRLFLLHNSQRSVKHRTWQTP